MTGRIRRIRARMAALDAFGVPIRKNVIPPAFPDSGAVAACGAVGLPHGIGSRRERKGRFGNLWAHGSCVGKSAGKSGTLSMHNRAGRSAAKNDRARHVLWNLCPVPGSSRSGALRSRVWRPLGVCQRQSPIRPRSAPHHGACRPLDRFISGGSGESGAVNLCSFHVADLLMTAGRTVSTGRPVTCRP